MIKNSLPNSSIAVWSTHLQCPFIDIKTNIVGTNSWYEDIKKGYEYILSHDEIKTIIMSHRINGSETSLDGNKDLYKIIYHSALQTFELLKEHNKNGST